MIRLSKIVKEGEEPKKFSNEVKKHFLEIVSTYNKYQEMMDRKSDIAEIAEVLGGITEAARELAVNESDDWFDAQTVKRNMSELAKLGGQFDKVAIEAKNLDQRLHGLYEDMGHILSRYYKMGEITEDQMKQRLGLRENKTLNESPNSDMINRNLKLLDKAADMAIKNPKGNVTELAKIIKKYTADIRKSLLESVNEALGNDKAMLALVDMLSNSMEHYASANEFVNITSKIPGFANYKSELKDVFAKYWKVDARQRNDWNTKEWLKWLKQWPLEESVTEEKPGLWANIRAKKARGEAPAHKNSDAHKDAVAAGKQINKEAAHGYKDSTASYIDKHKEEFKAAEKMNKGNEQSFYDSLSTLEEKLGHPKYMIFLSNALRGYKVDMYKDPKIKNQQEAEEALFLLSK